MDLIQFCHVTLQSLGINLQFPPPPRTEFKSRIFIIYWKHSVICIFNKGIEEYNVMTSENDVKHSNSNMEEMDDG